MGCEVCVCVCVCVCVLDVTGYVTTSLFAGVLDVMLGFFLSLFRGLRVQMGVAFTEQTLQTFITMFTRSG